MATSLRLGFSSVKWESGTRERIKLGGIPGDSSAQDRVSSLPWGPAGGWGGTNRVVMSTGLDAHGLGSHPSSAIYLPYVLKR